jgi:hypothetical protein
MVFNYRTGGVKMNARIISLDRNDDPWERVGLRVEMEVKCFKC